MSLKLLSLKLLVTETCKASPEKLIVHNFSAIMAQQLEHFLFCISMKESQYVKVEHEFCKELLKYICMCVNKYVKNRKNILEVQNKKKSYSGTLLRD